jgi:hypothetical protein
MKYIQINFKSHINHNPNHIPADLEFFDETIILSVTGEIAKSIAAEGLDSIWVRHTIANIIDQLCHLKDLYFHWNDIKSANEITNIDQIMGCAGTLTEDDYKSQYFQDIVKRAKWFPIEIIKWPKTKTTHSIAKIEEEYPCQNTESSKLDTKPK